MTVVNKFVIVLILYLVLSSCSSYKPINVRHVRNLEVGHNMQGFYYALPQSVVSLDFTIIKTEEKPGPFGKFAGKYLGLDNIIMENSTQYHIADVTISSYAEPDPAEFYFIEYNARDHRDNPFFISFSESGLITSVNTKHTNYEHYENMQNKLGYGFFGSEATFNQFIGTNLQEKIDTIVERVRMDTVTIERQTLRRSWVEKSSEVRAKEVADYILKIREKKFDIISGFAEITYSKEALQYMHDKLDEQENALLELFTGLTSQSKINYRMSVLPQKDLVGQKQVVFYFSESEGLSMERKTGTEPIEVEITRHNSTRQLGVFLPATSADRASNNGDGFYYRIPEYGHVKVKQRGNTIAQARMLINQFGVITKLPAEDLEMQFYPNTGSLRSVGKISEE